MLKRGVRNIFSLDYNSRVCGLLEAPNQLLTYTHRIFRMNHNTVSGSHDHARESTNFGMSAGDARSGSVRSTRLCDLKDGTRSRTVEHSPHTRGRNLAGRVQYNNNNNNNNKGQNDSSHNIL